jgi:23S rRNA (pseudouridine1915-N3)-methyltransferase
MKLELWYLKGKPEAWADQACDEYVEKLARFFDFTRVAIKSKSLDREDAEAKIKMECDAVISKLADRDLLVLFDESGRTFKTSLEFSAELVKILGQQSRRVVFLIGGPYGFNHEIRERARARWSLGGLTMNHHVAQVVALEQIYRGLTIWKGLPYHNV